ncbi:MULTISPECIES: CbiQ family ECF transporter T component [unclassified Granulicatella]|uniref:CbiQ family ECF transporter T component n=1 Tax=unclassified Granulicatella TaxID=2630493 RepID=UPI001D15FE62|nr:MULTISPECIES: CbiQ family ECF transporter T component [unclassified Granulicatella]
MIKFIVYLVLLGISFTEIPNIQLAFIFCIVPLTCYVAHVHWQTYMKWIVLTLPFVLLSLVSMIVTFVQNKDTLVCSIALFDGYLGISQQAIIHTSRLLLRIYSSLVATYFFVLTVPFQQLIVLFKQMKMPKFLLEVIILMYRFIFLFLHEFIVMRDTLDLKFSFGNFKQSYHSMGLLAKQLLTRLMKANEHVSQMLELRFDE